MSWVEEELAQVNLGDVRLNRRLVKMVTCLAEKPGESVPAAFATWSDTKAAYRFWDNAQVDPAAIRAAHALSTCARCLNEPLVLAVQDTTDFDFTAHPHTQGLGYLEQAYCRGLKVHSTFAVSGSGVPLGLLNQQVWVRPETQWGKTHQRRHRPTAEKESQRWLDALTATHESLAAAACVITVSDREADIFDLFALPRPAHRHLLVRAAQNRRVQSEQRLLWPTIEAAPVAGHLQVDLPRQQRQATLSLRFVTTDLRPPHTGVGRKTAQPLPVSVILAKEDAPPAGAEAVCWRLLTTWPVADLATAMQCVRWYSWRWRVERYHFTLKSGCHIEQLQLESAERLQRALATYCLVAWRLLWLTYAARETPEAPCTEALTQPQWQSLYRTVHRSARLPDQPPTLHQAVRWIAQLGGFLGRKGDGEPGVKVLWRGLRRLEEITATWELAQHLLTSVGSEKVVGNA